MRVVIDTNVLISAIFWTGRPKQLLNKVRHREITFITSKILLDELAENIESRPVCKSMHLQPVFNGCRVMGGEVSEDLFERGLCLPSGTQMIDEDLERVISVMRNCCKAGQ